MVNSYIWLILIHRVTVIKCVKIYFDYRLRLKNKQPDDYGEINFVTVGILPSNIFEKLYWLPLVK